MAILKKLEKFLNDNKIKFEEVEHRTVYTAWDSAETQHIKPQEVAKTLVVKLDSEYGLAVIPASKNLDKNKLKKVVNDWRKKQDFPPVKKVGFASEAWMKKNIPGKVGATPPFGVLFKLPTFVDRGLTKAVKLLVNSGDYTISVKLSTKQYLKVTEAVLGSLSMPKK